MNKGNKKSIANKTFLLMRHSRAFDYFKAKLVKMNFKPTLELISVNKFAIGNFKNKILICFERVKDELTLAMRLKL